MFIKYFGWGASRPNATLSVENKPNMEPFSAQLKFNQAQHRDQSTQLKKSTKWNTLYISLSGNTMTSGLDMSMCKTTFCKQRPVRLAYQPPANSTFLSE
jgi:hypothetical protein